MAQEKREPFSPEGPETIALSLSSSSFFLSLSAIFLIYPSSRLPLLEIIAILSLRLFAA